METLKDVLDDLAGDVIEATLDEEDPIVLKEHVKDLVDTYVDYIKLKIIG